jgi:hemerythrin
MTHLEWTEELHVGNDPINAQHKELFSIGNEFIDAIEDNKGQDILLSIFKRLQDYTAYHFKAEEKYMEEVGYPELPAHAAQHAILLIRTGTLKRMIENGETISPVRVAEFIREWITTHIMQQDVLIEKFARTNQ